MHDLDSVACVPPSKKIKYVKQPQQQHQYINCSSSSHIILSHTKAHAQNQQFLASHIIMRASHILVKHQGSRRTASWKDVDGVAIKNRTKVSPKMTDFWPLPHLGITMLYFKQKVYPGSDVLIDRRWAAARTAFRSSRCDCCSQARTKCTA